MNKSQSIGVSGLAVSSVASASAVVAGCEGRASVQGLSAAAVVGSGEKLDRFFTELGAPGGRERGEKPGTFFTSDAAAGQATSVPGAPASSAAEPLAPVRNRGGRPTVLTPEIKDRIELLLSVGMSRRQAAAYVGIDHTTLVKAAARDPEFRLTLQIAEEQATVNPLLTILSEARKNWRAAAWFLKYRGVKPTESASTLQAYMTDEEYEEMREREHRRKLADSAREAERIKLEMAAIREAVSGGPPDANPTQITIRKMQRYRPKR
jgi:hypothetical protein